MLSLQFSLLQLANQVIQTYDFLRYQANLDWVPQDGPSEDELGEYFHMLEEQVQRLQMGEQLDSFKLEMLEALAEQGEDFGLGEGGIEMHIKQLWMDKYE